MGLADAIVWLHQKACRPWMVPALWTLVVVLKVVQLASWIF